MDVTISSGRALQTIGTAVASCTLLALFSGCSGSSGTQGTADSITQAVYNNDAPTASSNFDDALKGQVTRTSVGELSNAMHRLGSYKGLTYLSADPQKNEFDYRANFSSGAMVVVLRLNSQGKATAYRVFPLHQ